MFIASANLVLFCLFCWGMISPTSFQKRIINLDRIGIFCSAIVVSLIINFLLPSLADNHPVQSTQNAVTIDQPAETSQKQLSQEDSAVYEKMKEKAKRDYPGDYYMQKNTYDMNVEAYEYMKTVKDIKLKNSVQREYPGDYYMQKGVYNMQIDAKEQLQ